MIYREKIKTYQYGLNMSTYQVPLKSVRAFSLRSTKADRRFRKPISNFDIILTHGIRRICGKVRDLYFQNVERFCFVVLSYLEHTRSLKNSRQNSHRTWSVYQDLLFKFFYWLCLRPVFKVKVRKTFIYCQNKNFYLIRFCERVLAR